MTTNNPLILTATLNRDAQHFFDAQRKQYFPPDKNFLAAHLTLFHHLPPGMPLIEEAVANACNSQQQIVVTITGVIFTGKGVAYKIESSLLKKLHKRFQQQWLPLLTMQDRQGLWPHITVQNKVSPAEAKALQSRLQQRFTPFDASITGFSLWEYLNGPWQLRKQYFFEAGV